MSQIKESLDKLREATEALEHNISAQCVDSHSVENLHKTLSQVQDHVEFIKQSLTQHESSPIRYVDECG